MRLSVRLLTLACTGLLLAHYSHAQQAADGYTAPRTIYGDPDLQGIWQTMSTAVWNIQDHPAELGIPAGQGVVVGNEIPYRADALEQREENRRNRATDDPEASCKMVGVPRTMYMPYPLQIFQTPGTGHDSVGVRAFGSKGLYR